MTPRVAKRLSVLSILAFAVVGTGPAPAQEPVVSDELGGKLDEYLSRLAGVGFSGAVLVARGGDVVLAKGYGMADREQGIPYTTETVATVGSITKPFTAAAILKLEMQGKLKVTDRIANYLPSVPPDKTEITIHHLLTHSSGLSHVALGDFDPILRDEYVSRALNAPLQTPPGEEYDYSNTGFSLLGAIIEIVTGDTYEKYLNENILRPAGMTSTGYLIPKWDPERLAQGYRGSERWGTVLERPWAPDGPYWALRANGGLHSTVSDMYRLHLALQGDELLQAEAKEKAFTPHIAEGASGRSHYGYGWSIAETSRGTTLITHNGGNGIFSADFGRYVDDDVVMAVFSSIAGYSATRIARTLGRIVFDGDYALPPAVVDVEPAVLAGYAGSYRLPSGDELEVSAGDNQLWIAPHGEEAFLVLGSGTPEQAVQMARYTERLTHILEELNKGSYEPLHEALGGEMSIEQLMQMEQDMRRQRERMFGPSQGVHVLGTMPSRGGAVTLVRFDFERGARLVDYHWRQDAIMGIRPGSPTTRTLYPQSTRDFTSFSMRESTPTRVTFELSPEGTVHTLIIHTSGAPVRAERQ